MTPQEQNVEARSALEQVLEALEEAHYKVEHKQNATKREQVITTIKKLLAQQNPQNVSNEQVEPKLKLMPKEATREMLEAMDACSMEGYDERLYAGHAGSVYMAAWDAFTHPPVPTAQPDLETKSATIERAREASRQLRERNKTTWNDVDREAVFAFEALIAVANFFYLKSKDTAQPKEPEQKPNKNGSPCPEFWDWLPKAYNFEGDGNFTKYNMEVAFLAGKQALAQRKHEQDPVGKIVDCDFVGNSIARFERHLPFGTLLYTFPPPQRPSRSDIKPLTDQHCTWQQSDDVNMPDTWEASCGAIWTFTEGGPKDNDMHYCPKCGKPAIEKAAHGITEE